MAVGGRAPPRRKAEADFRISFARRSSAFSRRNEPAYWRGHAGDPTTAATELEQLLTDQLRVLGPHHPHTLTTRANLRVLGPDDPDTRANLTYWRGRTRDES